MDLETELANRADVFNKELEIFLKKGEPKTLYDAARHLPLAGGKRLRPVMAMVACESVGGDVKKVMPVAIAAELIHSFTLVHDDIMDKSSLRRNHPTVHVKFNEPTAIMAGDLLFAKAFESLHNLIGDLSVFKKVDYGLINIIREICEGQQMDMEFENRKIVKEDEYLEMIRKKTAVFFQYVTEAGGIVGGGTSKQINGLNVYGGSVGLGFQIQDDYLDMSSDEETLGKDIGMDIRNGKKTLIAVHSLNKARGEDRKILHKIFGNNNATDDEVKQVYGLFNKLGSVEYARKTTKIYDKKAKKALNVLDGSDAKNILLELADYSTVKREK